MATKVGEDRETSRERNAARLDSWKPGGSSRGLEDATPEAVGEAALAHVENPEKAAKQALTHPSVVQENILCFEQVMKDRLEPYQVLVDIMRNAMKPEKVTREYIDSEGNTRFAIVYEDRPDWKLRKDAAVEIFTLMGKHPRLEVKMNVMTTGDVGLQCGNIWLEMARIADPTQQLEAYNAVNRGASPKVSVIEGEYREG